jgi:hypothetical protein
LLLAHFTNGVVFLLKKSIIGSSPDEEQPEGGKRLTRRESMRLKSRSRKEKPLVTTENPMLAAARLGSVPALHLGKQPVLPITSFSRELAQEEPAGSACHRRMLEFYDYMIRTLRPVGPQSQEATRWREMEENDCLSSYFDLLRLESNALFGTAANTAGESKDPSFYLFSARGVVLLQATSAWASEEGGDASGKVLGIKLPSQSCPSPGDTTHPPTAPVEQVMEMLNDIALLERVTQEENERKAELQREDRLEGEKKSIRDRLQNFALQNHQGRFATATPAGGLTWNATRVQGWERFYCHVVSHNEGETRVGFKSAHGKFMCAESNG